MAESFKPLSLAMPTPSDLALSEGLVKTLKENNMYESEGEASHREDVRKAPPSVSASSLDLPCCPCSFHSRTLRRCYVNLTSSSSAGFAPLAPRKATQSPRSQTCAPVSSNPASSPARIVYVVVAAVNVSFGPCEILGAFFASPLDFASALASAS